ncbi:MAG: aspartate--tRNA(Asn) ligase [Clostridiales bacterium 38-18]|nr:MAG: aspartate--tRNA(Asn) ligase [Clostridiales bacterium 38-18]
MGWVHRIKRLKTVVFIILRDRTGLVQCAFAPELIEPLELTLETVICLTGKKVKGKNDYADFEIAGERIEVLNPAAGELPVAVNGKEIEVQLETLLKHRVLGLRHPKEQAIFKIQSLIGEGFRKFLSTQGFTEIHSPKLVKEGAEGGANVFKLDYFGETAYLAQSPQFYKQMMVISGMERVFEVGSVFRAEAHSTSRHLNEYVSLDLEMGFIFHEDELMRLETELLRSIMSSLKENGNNELSILEVTLPEVPDEIPHMKLSEAIAILKENYGKTELEGDLDPEGEKLISQYIYETTGSEFVFLTHYPKRKRPMYTMPCGEEETHSFDLLFRGMEITTGGRRIHRLDMLIQSMREKGLDPEQYESYLEAFKYGAPPHGGLAIGLERLTALLLGFSNVRRTSLFPRDGQRLVP